MSLGLLVVSATATASLSLQAYDVCRSGGIETGFPMNRSDDCPQGTSCQGLPGDIGIGGEVSLYCIPDDVQLCQKDGDCGKGFCAAVALEDGNCSRVRQCKEGNLGLAETCQVDGDTYDCKRSGCGAELVCQVEDPHRVYPFGRKAPALQSTRHMCHPRPPPLKVFDGCRIGGIETGYEVDRSGDCPEGTRCEGRPGVWGIGGEVPMYCIPVEMKLCNGDEYCDKGSFCRRVTMPDGKCSVSFSECVEASGFFGPCTIDRKSEDRDEVASETRGVDSRGSDCKTMTCASGTCLKGRCFF